MDDVSGLRPPGRRWVRQLFWLPVATAVASAVWLGVHTTGSVRTARTAGGAIDQNLCTAPRRSLGFINGRGFDELLVAVLAVSLVAALVAYRLPRRREQTSLLLVSLSALALTAVGLGLAAYVPATQGSTPFLGPASWVLALFLGNTTPGHLCREPYPVGFETAQVAAIVATGSGVLAGAGATWQAQWVRLRIRFASDLDVVVGLDELTIPLVRRLEAEAASWRRREAWLRPRSVRRADLRLVRLTRPKVVVVAQERSDPLVALARSAGALVWVVDLRAGGAMRRLVLSPGLAGPHVAVRRLFLLGRDQFANTELHDRATRELSRARLRHVRDVVPRIVVRMDDPREAAAWRLTHVGQGAQGGTVGWFSDAVSSAEVTAHNLADLVDRSGKGQLVLVGDSMLTLALLEEVSWRRWVRFVLREQSAEYERSAAAAGRDAAFRAALAAEAEEPALTEVLLVSAAADDLEREWRETRPPLGEPRLAALATRSAEVGSDEGGAVTVHVDVPDGENPSLAAFLRGRDAIVVLTEPVPGYARDVLRASRAHDSRLVVAVPDPEVHGVGEALVDGGVIRYGPSWLMSDAVIEDSWGGLARLRHSMYRHRWVGGRPDPASSTQGPWTLAGGPDELGGFFRSDNLRQLRHVLRAVEELGYTWTRMTLGGRGPRLTDEELLAVARSEHERWVELREANGWKLGTVRDDGRRFSTNLLEWDGPGSDGLRARNLEDIRDLLGILRATGLVPTRQTHRRIGTVHAQRLTEDRTWPGPNGATMHSRAGDWWVTDDDGSGRGVAPGSFLDLYEPVDADAGSYRRIGTVMAWRSTPGEVVATLEGPVTLDDDHHMVVLDEVSSWPVPERQFREGYVPIDAATG